MASILPCLVYLAAFVATGWVLIQLWNAMAVGNLSAGVFAGLALVGMLVLGVISVIFPTMSRFENGPAQLLKNAVFLAMANLPRTLALGILNGVSIFLCARFVVPLFFLPALAALISTLFLEPMFKPYMHQEEN